MFRFIKRLPWIALGGAAVWFFDPKQGAGRRHDAQQRLAELVGRTEPLEEPIPHNPRAEAAA